MMTVIGPLMVLALLFAPIGVAVWHIRHVCAERRAANQSAAPPITAVDVEVFGLELEWGGDYLVAALKRERRQP